MLYRKGGPFNGSNSVRNPMRMNNKRDSWIKENIRLEYLVQGLASLKQDISVNYFVLSKSLTRPTKSVCYSGYKATKRSFECMPKNLQIWL
ncbi:Hypothetical predicted protein [Octopus vulgaris]|uniref:Uncharacterized protein n=1 Tax=Octopus vulgaris TaxID=6645 RepID=A0AA36FEA0_OCTVU|nr:Hypothetical predicted protein [Octopus vulgaris]